MAAPVTTAGSLTCPHHGRPALDSNAKLTVQGKHVLLFSAVAGLTTYVGCQFTAGGAPKPCQRTIATTPDKGSATKLTVGGSAAVLLDGLQAITDNPPTDANGDPRVKVDPGQNKLTAS